MFNPPSFENFSKQLHILLQNTGKNLNQHVDTDLVYNLTLENIDSNPTWFGFMELAAVTAASLSTKHPDYNLLGGRILMQILHKKLNIPNYKFSDSINKIYFNQVNGIKSGRISDEVYEFVQAHKNALDKMCDYSVELQEYNHGAVSSFSARGLEKINDVVVQTPAQSFLKVAVGLYVNSPRSSEELDSLYNTMKFKPSFNFISQMSELQRLAEIQNYFTALVNRKISIPGPILMHAGSKYNQMPSCYLQYCSDSLTGDEYNYTGVTEGIMSSLTQMAAMGKAGGATGVTFSEIRSSGSPIIKTNGKTNGIIPFMKMFDATIGAINQGGKRAGVCTVYLEPWHKDIIDFLDSIDHFTIEEKRCKNLFIALYANDLFFKRLVKDKNLAKWTLFDPAICRLHLGHNLTDVYGEQFEKEYEMLEAKGLGRTIDLMEIWMRVCKLLQQNGMPYILNKDQINLKSNQKNYGIVKQSNVCTEITLHNNEDETAVCVLSSLCLGRFFNPTLQDGVDYEAIIETAKIITRSLNNVIDLQHYPTRQTRNSCLARRPIGVGAMGLADLFIQLDLEYTSEAALEINKKIYECIYYGCLLESNNLAKIDGSYLGFVGSPAQNGILQYDMWEIDEENLFLGKEKWQALKTNIKQFGLRNVEVTAIAPTMSSSIRMQQCEMHEPFGRLLYIRQTISGPTQIINEYLVEDLIKLNLWSDSLATEIIANDGSIANITTIPQNIKDKYQTVYEIDYKIRNQMMQDRSAFVSQSSSYNQYLTFEKLNLTSITQLILDGWQKKLKTLSYYFHSEAATTGKKEFAGNIKATKAHSTVKSLETLPLVNIKINNQEQVVQTFTTNSSNKFCDPNDDTCESCSS